MAIKIGTTAITSVGKIKLGTTNITKVYKGSTQIFPSQTYSFPAALFSSLEPEGGCAITPTGTTYYSNTAYPNIGNIMYTNSSLTTVVGGNNQWFSIGGNMGGTAWQINNSGVIIDAYDCGF